MVSLVFIGESEELRRFTIIFESPTIDVTIKRGPRTDTSR